MNPHALFPWLALLFVVLALVQRARIGRWRGAAATWLILALIFGAVALGLRWA
ncbi:MAG: hypothetical protein KGN16_25450 [Burkholderiales bacterium]|nr:hypothetical protein [Burkholderiales bacterium]